MRSIETLTTLYKSSRRDILEGLNLQCVFCEKGIAFLGIIDLELGLHIYKSLLYNVVRCSVLKIRCM
jgi:hypothetical protein